MESVGILKPQFWHDKSVLITGHTGFKGSWLSLWLQQLGANVIGYALEPSTEPNLFDLADVSSGMDSHIGDIRDYDHLLSVINSSKPEFIIHMAAQPLVRQSYQDPIETYSTNVIGTVTLLETIRHSSSVRAVVNVTTDKCYDNKEWEWGYRENERLGGHDPYSNSKACSELVTSAYRDSFFPLAKYDEHGVALASARAGNVIGGGDWAPDRLLPDCINSFLKKETALIRNPASVRPWQHVLEPLGGYLLLAMRLREYGPKYAQAWNFGPDHIDHVSVKNIVEYLTKHWKGGAKWDINKDSHPHESNVLKLDCTKARTHLGWHPIWNLNIALDKVIEWYATFVNQQESIKDITLRQISLYRNGFEEIVANECK